MSEISPDAGATTAIVKQLADAVSMQARLANRTWLATMATSLLVLLPRSSAAGSSGTDVTLPFQLGAVALAAFYPVAFAMLAVLVVALSSAQAQQARASDLAQRELDSLAKAGSRPLQEVSIRELFDMFRIPSVNRVAPLAQLLRGKYQFHDRAASCPRWLRVTSSVYYLAVKLVASSVYYGLPGIALWYSFAKTISIHIPAWLLALLVMMGLIAAVSLLEVVIADLAYVLKVAVRILGRRPTGPAN